MNIKVLTATAAAAMTLAISTPTLAATYLFDSVGDSFAINFNGFTDQGGPSIPGLTATITYTLTGFAGNSATFSYIVDNTSSAPVTNSRISAFGFNVDPNFTTAAIVTGTTYTNISSGNVPNGLPNVEFCLTNVNCSGGGGGGVSISDPNALGSFVLNYGSQPASVTLSDLYVRYQSLDVPSLGINGGSATGIPINGVIPEPTTWAMMLLGFFGMGSILRMQRRRRAIAA